MNFNMNDYEPVKKRKQRFYKDHVDGRIVVHLVNSDTEEKAVFKVEIFFNADEQAHGLPRATGYALEIRDKEVRKNKYGKDYESVNFTSWMENCEESAVGRALDNAGYASNAKPSLEEMNKAQRHVEQFNKGVTNEQANRKEVKREPIHSAVESKQDQHESVSTDSMYRIGFGKFKDKTLAQITEEFGIEEIEKYCFYISDKAQKENKPVKGQVKEFLDQAARYLEADAERGRK